ncbi:hypothetical protein ACJX0J_022423, partial [Zea mays]
IVTAVVPLMESKWGMYAVAILICLPMKEINKINIHMPGGGGGGAIIETGNVFSQGYLRMLGGDTRMSWTQEDAEQFNNTPVDCRSGMFLIFMLNYIEDTDIIRLSQEDISFEDFSRLVSVSITQDGGRSIEEKREYIQDIFQ